LVEQVGGGHDPDDAPALEDQQAADRSSPHQIGGLTERGGWTGAHGIGGHQITNGAVACRCRSSCAAKIAFGDNPHKASVLHHDEMADAVSAHRGPCDARGVISTNGNHFNAHHISESHDHTSCKGRAGLVTYRLNPCLRVVNRSRLRREATPQRHRTWPISP
jgi:hypothetical protein